MENYYTIYYYEIPSLIQRKVIVKALSRKKAFHEAHRRMISSGVKIHVYYIRKGAYQ